MRLIELKGGPGVFEVSKLLLDADKVPGFGWISPQQSKRIESHSEQSATRMINMRILEKCELDIDFVLDKTRFL